MNQQPDLIKKMHKLEPRFKLILNEIKSNSVKYLAMDKKNAVEILNFIERPGARLVRANIKNSKKEKIVYIKISKNLRKKSENFKKSRDKYRKDYETLVKLNKQLEKYPEYAVLKPVVFYEEYPALVTLESAGVNFHDLLLQELPFWKRNTNTEKLSNYALNCGKWLRVFQQTSQYDSNKTVKLEDLKNYIDIRLTQMIEEKRKVFPFTLREKILNYYDKFAELFDEKPMPEVWVHGDYCPVNVLVSENSTVVLDFPMIRKGPIWQDVARFYTQLENLKYKKIYPAKTIKKLQNSFLQGYNENLNADNKQFKLLILQHIITHLRGLTKYREKKLHSRVFSRWICSRHIEEIKKITGE